MIQKGTSKRKSPASLWLHEHGKAGPPRLDGDGFFVFENSCGACGPVRYTLPIGWTDEQYAEVLNTVACPECGKDLTPHRWWKCGISMKGFGEENPQLAGPTWWGKKVPGKFHIKFGG